VAGLASRSIPTGDVFGNVWALTWVSRHLAAPGRLFAANIYYPDPASLAYTESLLAQSFVAAPFLAAGAAPVTAYNLCWLLTFPLSGLGTYLLAKRLTGSTGGALLAGLGYAFGSYRLDAAVHLQTLSIQWLPFVLLFVLRSLETPSLRNLVGLGAFLLLQALSSGYYAALLAPAVLLTLAFHVATVPRASVLRVLLAMAIAVVVAAPAFLPYWRAERRLDLARSPGDLVSWSATWSSYARPSGQARSPTLTPLRRVVREGPALHPGTAIALLAVVGVASSRRRPVPFLVALAATGVLLSLGPEVRLGPVAIPGPFEVLRRLPGYRLLRTPYRMAPLALLSLSVLAAVGWAALARTSLGRRGVWALLALAVLEGSFVGVSELFRPMPPPPAFARWLARAPTGPVLEVPWKTYDGRSVYWSVTHEHRLVNGWGAFAPPESIRLGTWGERWPGPGAVRVLRGGGVRYVVVHTDRVPSRQKARLAEPRLPRGVHLVAEFGDDRIYTISSEGPADPPPASEEGRR
jgi:hypothetical protein